MFPAAEGSKLESDFCSERSVSVDGGVRSPAPPGKEREEGPVKAFACKGVAGCVVRLSMLGSGDRRDGDV